MVGTVLGMIRSFAAMSKGSPDTAALATGISEALINTALGIGTSAISIIMYNFFTSKIDELTYRRDKSQLIITESESIQHEWQKNENQRKSLTMRKTSLIADRSELDLTITALNANFSDYVAEYRQWAWSSAVGEKVDLLKLTSGREYRDAVISRVTADGLEVRHEFGAARIPSSELDSEWQKRMQWKAVPFDVH